MVSKSLLALFFMCLVKVSLVHSQDLSLIDFILFNDNYPDDGYEVDFFLGNIAGSGYQAGSDVYFLIHGWNSNILFAKRFVPELLKNEPSCQIFGVDWSAIENFQYFEAAATSQEVGKHVANFVNNLIADRRLDLSNVHVIGHSLGAQASGAMGREIQSLLSDSLPRISGLDPAKPWFDANPQYKLSRDDAKYVDVIHTNSGDLADGCLSFMEPLGHADFYPNGGAHQNGCVDDECRPNCTEDNIKDMITACSHLRANKYYSESVFNATNGFISQQCRSYPEYTSGTCNGEIKSWGHHHKDASGEYYLNTNADTPYACYGC